MILNRRSMTALLVTIVIFTMMLVPVVAVDYREREDVEGIDESEIVDSLLLYNLEHNDGKMAVYTAVQTSDYTFIVNAVLLIIASVTFILIRIKRNDKNQK